MSAAHTSKFQRLALTHALMMGAEATMVVALADSFFFDVDPNGARTKVLAFLLVSFTPFLLVAPLLGPAIDRVRGGRRLIVQGVAVARMAVQLLMIRFVDDVGLFGLVFVALVLQKTYLVSRSALVPSVVRNDHELVEANSKLGLIAGLAGVVAVVPAGLLQVTIGTGATLAYGAGLFGLAFFAALRLPREMPPQPAVPGSADPGSVRVPALALAAAAMMVLRGAVGFMLFHLAFWFRSRDGGDILLGAAVGLSSLAIMAGNTVGPTVRRTLHEERMLTVALALPAVAGLVAALLGGGPAGVALAVVVNFSAALGRLAFDSIVQRDGPATNRGQVFARFETSFQLAWVAAAVLPVLFELPSRVGLFLVGAVSLASAGNYFVGVHAPARPVRAGS